MARLRIKERVALLLVSCLLCLCAALSPDEHDPPLLFSPSTNLLLDRHDEEDGSSATGRAPSYYLAQLVDHLASSGDENDDRWSKYAGRTWRHRFYSMGTHFGGPGSPIFVFMGGEGAIEPEHALYYPFVTERLAPLFQAFVLHPEHRFYGASQPISSKEIRDETSRHGGIDPRVELLTAEQALRDYVRLIRAVRDQLGCSRDKFSSRYCPLVAIGGSYPAWLAAMARLRFPYVVDMAYAASAPMKFYAQQVSQDAYYDHITSATDAAFPGCAAAVRTSLGAMVDYFRGASDSFADHTNEIGICDGTVPDYCLRGDVENFIDEVVMMAGYTFANLNMAYYPPSPDRSLGRACQTFLSSNLTALQKVSQFFVDTLGDRKEGAAPLSCFNMSAQLPTGPNATITSGDWSGVGTGPSGESWDFQTCTLLVETIGFGNSSMFPPRSWSIEWLNQHCRDRFPGAVPKPTELAQEWGFDDLVAAGASNILFTNGLVDGWSVSGIQTNLSDTLLAINFPQGAHHSDLSYYHGNDDSNATDDIRHGRDQIQTILSNWLAELPNQRSW